MELPHLTAFAAFVFHALNQIGTTAANSLAAGAVNWAGKTLVQWTGLDKDERRAAFARAVTAARERTLAEAENPAEAKRVLDALDRLPEQSGSAFADEAAKLMLISSGPDLSRLELLCSTRLKWDGVYASEEPPLHAVAPVLSDLLSNLKEALLDQEPYRDLLDREVLQTLRMVLAEIQPGTYEDEDTYRRQLAQQYRKLDFIGIPELKERRPISIADIFVRLQAMREVDTGGGGFLIPGGFSGDDPEEDPRGSLEPMALAPILTEEVSINRIVERARRLVILGEPGAGKTTLLKYLAVICAEGRFHEELDLPASSTGSPLPIFVSLRAFAGEWASRESDYTLLEYFHTYARERLLVNLPPSFFERALEEGRCILCIDGLDEVWAPGQRSTVCDAVRALASKYPRNRFLVTSRIVGYEDAPLDRSEFTHLTVLPLTEASIRLFIEKWYGLREDDPVLRTKKVEDLFETIRREARILTLACNPLLLTIICLVHRIEADLPQDRAKLYEKCVTTLVDTWEEVKGLTLEEKSRPFYQQRRRLLERLAYELHSRALGRAEAQTIREGDLELLLVRLLTAMKRLGLEDDPEGAHAEAKAFIRLAEERVGLLVERGSRVFGFPHLTFQEYLAAQDIEHRLIHRGVDVLWNEVSGRLMDPQWREVILLLLSGVERYDECQASLLERIRVAAADDPFEPMLHRHLLLLGQALADGLAVPHLRKRVIEELLSVARERPWWERIDALAVLATLRDHAVTDCLLERANDHSTSPGVRLQVCEALVTLGRHREVLGTLAALAQLPDVGSTYRIGVLAVAAVAKAAGHDAAVLPKLAKLARDAALTPNGRVDAARFLMEHNREEAVGVLEEIALDPAVRSWARGSAATVLCEYGAVRPELVGSLLAQACDRTRAQEQRQQAVNALAGLRSTSPEVIEKLLELLSRASGQGLRQRCARALGILGMGSSRALSRLQETAENPQNSRRLRLEAAVALGNLGSVNLSANLLLALAVDVDTGVNVVMAALRTLEKMRPEPNPACVVLQKLTRDTTRPPEVRICACVATSSIDVDCADEAAEVLVDLTVDLEVTPFAQRQAALSVRRLPHLPEAQISRLERFVKDESAPYGRRLHAASTLSRFRQDEGAARLLIQAYWDLVNLPESEAYLIYDTVKRLTGCAAYSGTAR